MRHALYRVIPRLAPAHQAVTDWVPSCLRFYRVAGPRRYDYSRRCVQRRRYCRCCLRRRYRYPHFPR